MRPLTRAGIAVAAALLLAFAAQCAWFVRANSPTYDEGLTLVSGELLWRGGPDVNGEHPPLARRLASLPIHLLRAPRIDLDLWHARRESPFGLGQMFLYEGGVPHSELLTLGRAPMVGLALLLVELSRNRSAASTTGAFVNFAVYMLALASGLFVAIRSMRRRTIFEICRHLLPG